MGKIVPANRDKKILAVKTYPSFIWTENVTPELDKYRKGDFYPNFLIIDLERKGVNFKDNTKR